MIDNNNNNLPDILEEIYFEDGDILMADTMNAILDAIKGTYDILNRAPELNYTDIDGFRQNDTKEWHKGDNMKLYFNFSSPVYGKVMVTVKQFKDGNPIGTIKREYEQGEIEVDLGVATEYARYQYEVTAVDGNGRQPQDGDQVKKLIFNQVVSGFEFNVQFDNYAANTYFIAGQDISIYDIPFTFDYEGVGTGIIKQIVYYIDEENAIPHIVEVGDTVVNSTFNLNINCEHSGQQNLIIQAQVFTDDNVETPIQTATITYPIYFGETEYDVVITLVEAPDFTNLTSDSRVEMLYKVSWFRDWGNSLNVFANGNLSVAGDEAQTFLQYEQRQLITTNHSIVKYVINSFPYYNSTQTFQISMELKCEGSAAIQAQLKSSDEYSGDGLISHEFYVYPGTGIEYQTNGLLANFEAKNYTNNVTNKEQWYPSNGTKKDEWYIDLQNCSYINAAESNNQAWDEVGAGWKEEYDEEGNYSHQYLHLKHNAYGVLKLKDTPEQAFNLKDYFSNQDFGFTLETYIKTNSLVNAQGCNLSCVTNNQQNGFIVKPNAIGILNNIDISHTGAQVNNVTTTLDQEWTHVTFIATSGKETETNPTLKESEIHTIENQLPSSSVLQLYINGALVKMSTRDIAQNDYYLYLNTLINEINSNTESDTKIQVLRLYNRALRSEEVRANYLSILTNQEQKDIINHRNSGRIPTITFTVLGDSKNGFDNAPNGGYAINNFTTADKPSSGSFPGAGKVYVKCAMHYSDGDIQETNNYVNVAVQGTSSLTYPIKNYKIVVYDNETGTEKNKTYAPIPKSEVWKGDSTYTLKCDYMDHSHKNNTPTAKFYNEILLPAILGDEQDKWSPARRKTYNDAIDGFPIILYYQDYDWTNGKSLEPKYIGTYMFNTDKSGLDQGFEIPISTTTMEIEYYPDGYIGEKKDNGEIEIKGNGDSEKITITTDKCPCISYEGGSNVDASAATFVSYDAYEQFHAINPALHQSYKDKWEYYNDTLEPRYNVFDENDIENLPLTFSPLDKAITWINTVWPKVSDEEMEVKSLINQSSIQSEEYWTVDNGNIDFGDTINFTRTRGAQSALFKLKNNIITEKEKRVLQCRFKCDTPTTDTTFKIEFTGFSGEQKKILFSNTITISPNTPTENLTQTFMIYTSLTTDIQCTFTLYSDELRISEFKIIDKGPDIFSLDIPLFNSNQIEKYQGEFKEYFSYEYCLAYYLQALVFTQADNIGKNAMFDVWWDFEKNDWSVIYPRPYDMDSQMGLNNQGQDIVLSSAEFNVQLSPDPNEKNKLNQHRRYVNQYAVSFSKLWLLFGRLFEKEIKTQYETLRKSIYTIETISSIVEDNTTLAIGECYYNSDALRKFVFPVEETTNWRMISGNRYHRYYSFLQERLDFLDSYFQSPSAQSENQILLRANKDSSNLTFINKKPYYLVAHTDTDGSQTIYSDPTTPTTRSITAAGNNKNIYIFYTKQLQELQGLTNFELETIDIKGTRALQTLLFTNQNWLQELKLSNLTALRNLEVNNCNNFNTLQLPSQISTLSSLKLKNLNEFTSNLDLINSGLIELELDNLGSNKTDKTFELNITNAPLQSIKITNTAQVSKLVLDNCYQLKAFEDEAYENKNLIALQEIIIQNCPKLKRIKLPNCTANKITIKNCPNLTVLDLSNSLAITELDLSLLPNVQELNLSNCSNLTKLIIPKNGARFNLLNVSRCNNLSTFGKPGITKGHFNFEDVELGEEALSLNETAVEQIHNLDYTGNGEGLFYNCQSLQKFSNTTLNFTGKSANRCFSGCTILQPKDEDEDGGDTGITFGPNEVETLNSTFEACSNIRLFIPYQLALASPKAREFQFYIGSTKHNYKSETPWAWPEDAKNHGFFAIKSPESGTFEVRDYIINTYGTFYSQYRITEIPNNIFLNVKGITTCLATFCGTGITEIDLPAIMSPIFTQEKYETTGFSFAVAFRGCNQLTEIGNFADTTNLTSWSGVNITNINGMFFGCTALTQTDNSENHNHMFLHLLRALPTITTAKGAFWGTPIESLNYEDQALFANNKVLKSAAGMFAECPNLTTLPTCLCTNDEGYALKDIAGIFAKAITTGVKRLEINSLNKNFFGSAPLTNLGTATINSTDWTININATTSGGAFAGSDFTRDIPSNIFENISDNLISLSGCFQNTVGQGIKTIKFVLTNCSKLTNINNLFAGSQIEEIKYPLINNNNKIEHANYCFKNSNLTDATNVPLWTLPKVTGLVSAFENCKQLLYNNYNNENAIIFESNKLTRCDNMFKNCLNFGDAGLSSVGDARSVLTPEIFTKAINLQNTSGMFKNCYSLVGQIPVDLFKSNILLESTSGMFQNCSCLTGIKIPDIFTNESATYDKLTNISYMFSGCGLLGKTYADIGGRPLLISHEWLLKCPSLRDISGLFAMVGSCFNPVSYNLDPGDPNSSLNTDHNRLSFINFIDRTTKKSEQMVPYRYYNQLYALAHAIKNDTNVKEAIPLNIDLTTFAGSHVSNITYANEVFAGMDRVNFTNLNSFLKVSANTLPNNLLEANGCFNNCSVKNRSGSITHMPFYIDEFTINSNLSLEACYANVFIDTTKQEIFNNLTLEQAETYIQKFINKTQSALAYKREQDNSIPAYLKTPTEDKLSEKSKKFRYYHTGNTNYLYQYCKNNFDFQY